MARLNPIQESEFIENEFREYLKYTFNFNDDEYRKQFIQELDRQSLYKGPYLNVSLPFVSTKSINELIEEGKVSSLFRNLNNINLDQKLYKHQEQSIDKICNGKNVVITTGTGSGKTESFLYPVLNTILKDIEIGNNGPGIRAILLYPMNALVNDQIDRVRKILTGFPDIRYGFFTGETEEKSSKKLREKISNLAGVEIPENEVLSREEIRENPPHLLFTNYSMLEYLLIRPNDFKIFSPDYLKNWKFVILDEAHTYNGALGIEVSLLLRRLTGLCDKKPNFLLTSATLGKKDKDEKDIVAFAESLTSSKFYPDDIIFATRKQLDPSNIEYYVDPVEYSRIEEKLDDIQGVSNILKKYINPNGLTLPEMLFEFLVRDKNVYDLYNNLSMKNYMFHEAMQLMSSNNFVKNEDLIALIHLVNIARKNFKNLYDIKYHTFIRTLSGAYITLKPHKYMKLSPQYSINDLRAFELGNCRYCNTPYIFGKEINGYLRQNSDVDIYENYGDNENVNVDYYLLLDSIDVDNVNTNICEENILCGNCGYIYNAANKNASHCNCSDDYKIKVYKVNSTTSKNNIYECPCCGHHAVNGVVRSVNLGKDEATAILAQILYKAIDDNETEKENSELKLSFSIAPKVEKKLKNDYIKQFIAFSDSRQQASFFASFFESNHNRFLRKKLIWEAIKKNNYEDIRFNTLVTKLEKTIQEGDLFPDSPIDSNKQAWVTALSELLNVDGGYGAEGLGIFYFTLDLDWILNEIGDDGINSEFGKYNINKKDLSNVLNVIFNVFRSSTAIDYTSAGLTPLERQDFLGYGRFEKYIKLQKPRTEKGSSASDFIKDGNIRSLLPISETKNNIVVNYIIKVFKCDRDMAITIISLLFNVIGEQGQLFEKSSKINDTIYQISTDKYILKNYKVSKFYRCDKCGSLTPYNVHNVCPSNECSGTLHECDPDEELKTNYYRKEYLTKKIERIKIKEHTAQLKVETAKEYQKDFKDKKINILSCSTTFEMGVDIGGLETVFMRNVPPTPANYVQRAGRAGRRDDSSAFVLTFCGNTSHDYTYFESPEKMISGEIKPPKFSVTNEKIILRHLLATAFGMFFRQNRHYFENINTLVCEGGIRKFKEYLESRPDVLKEFIDTKILDDKTHDLYSDFKWLDELKKNGDYLDNFEKSITDLISQYEIAKEDAKAADKLELANYYLDQINKLKKEKVIQNLSKYNVIPKYGFPVDVVDLQIWNDGKIDQKYDLSRDLSIAISEYAPESEVIVDKCKYTSRYITLPKTGQFKRYYYFTCPNCERDNINEIKDKLIKCEYCGVDFDEQVNDYFIEPIYGFKTGVNKESSIKKPKKTYVGATSYLGDGRPDEKKLVIGTNNYITIETTSDDELLVMNKNPFFMCDECGYSEIIKGKNGILSYPKSHLNFKGKQCSCDTLHPISLGHKFKTDVAKLTINELNNKAKALSLLYALLEGISQEFSIERKDIDGIVVKNMNNEFDLIIYDNVPGGAGHVKRIMDERMLVETFELALKKVKQNCCDEDSSCYNCLRNYNNQSYHKLLKRKLAIEAFDEIFKNI